MSDGRGMDAAEALNRIARAVEEAAAKVVGEWRESNAGNQAAPADGMDLLTAEEREALDLSGQLAVLCRRIVGSGPQADHDWNELASRIHAVQQTIMAQAAARAYPDKYRLLGGAVTGPPPGPSPTAQRFPYARNFVLPFALAVVLFPTLAVALGQGWLR